VRQFAFGSGVDGGDLVVAAHRGGKLCREVGNGLLHGFPLGAVELGMGLAEDAGHAVAPCVDDPVLERHILV